MTAKARQPSLSRLKRNALSTSIILMLGATPAFAQESRQALRFDIDSKPADEALIEFASQANLTVVFPYSTVKDIQANNVQGFFFAKQAINTLLKGTRLQAKITPELHIVVSEIPEVPPQPDSLFQTVVDFIRGDENLITIEPQKDISPYEHIMVRGYRASVRESLAVKRDSDLVVDNIQAVEIGKFPDQNLAESLQRIAGVAIDRAEGEGQFVTVRGFGPEFNTVLLNGRQMATDNLGREFSFDTLASELVSGVSVYKTRNAVIQSGGIGATIDVETARPLAIPHFQFVGNVKGQYDRNSRAFSPQYSALISNTWNDNTFGMLLAHNKHHREARIDEAQIDGWLVNTNIPENQLEVTTDNVFVPRNYDQRVRFDERTREGTTLVLQYRPREGLEIVLDALRTRLDVSTQATSMGHWFTSSNLEQVSTDSNGTVVAFQQHIGHATDFHARTFDRPSSLDAVGLNLDYKPEGAFSLALDIAYSRAKIDDQNGAANGLSLIGYLNRSAFDHSQNDTLPHISGFASADVDVVDANGNRSGVSHYLDPANGKAHVMLRRGWNIQDEIRQIRLNGSWDNDLIGLSYIDFGYQFTAQTKHNIRIDNEANASHCVFCGYFDSPDIPDDFQQGFSAGDAFLRSVPGHQHIPKEWLRHNGEQLFQYLERAGDVDLTAVQRGSSFEVEESVHSAYIDLVAHHDFRNMSLTSHLGIRYELTEVNINGFNEQLQRLDILDQTELGPVTGKLEPVAFASDYDNWLPSLNLKLDINEHLTGRMAVSRSLTRPTIAQMSPGVTLNTTRQGGDLRASSGNPNLLPYESDNLDLFFDYYYLDNSFLSVGYFAKDVSNFITTLSSKRIFNDVTDPSTGLDPLAPDAMDSFAEFDLSQPKNSEQATVEGIEFSVSHQFGETGFGVLANMTLVDSNAQLNRSDVTSKFALTGLSDSANMVIFYEKHRWQWRLAWNRRDGFLQSLLQRQSSEPTFVAPYEQLDFSMSFDINPNITLFFEGINLTNEVVWKRGRYDNQLLLIQDTGTRYSIGVSGKL